MFSRILKILFFGLIAKPVVMFMLGLNIFNKHRLPISGPAIIAPNHNSHLDTIVVMCLFPLSKIHLVRPVAASDYFLSNKLLAWFTLNILGVIPISRYNIESYESVFDQCYESLKKGEVLIFFPEGSRGEAEKLAKPKKGMYYLMQQAEHTKVLPVALHGLGRSLPKGSSLFVPFNCDVVIGSELPSCVHSDHMVDVLENTYLQLLQQCITKGKDSSQC